jgi:hypothetical protein
MKKAVILIVFISHFVWLHAEQSVSEIKSLELAPAIAENLSNHKKAEILRNDAQGKIYSVKDVTTRSIPMIGGEITLKYVSYLDSGEPGWTEGDTVTYTIIQNDKIIVYTDNYDGTTSIITEGQIIDINNNTSDRHDSYARIALSALQQGF